MLENISNNVVVLKTAYREGIMFPSEHLSALVAFLELGTAITYIEEDGTIKYLPNPTVTTLILAPAVKGE